MGRDCLLGDVLTLQRGYDLPSHARREGPIPIVSSSGVTGTHAEAKVAGPGVITGRYGTLGEIHYVSGPFWPLNTTLYVRDFKGNDPRFVAYFLRTLNFANRSAAAAVPGINRNDLHRIPVHCPDLQQQRRIASILSAYDDLIENNTRRIAILEEMARRVYDEWFVRFRFPGHEGVRMVESELGLVPEGWEVKALGEIVDDIVDYRGKTPAKLNGEWSSEGVLALSALNVKRGRLVNLEKSRSVSEELYARWMKNPIKRGDILMTSEAPLGELFFLQTDQRYCLSQRIYSIRANRQIIKPVILYLSLDSKGTQDELASRATGATVSGIRQSELRKVPIVVAPRAVQLAAEPVLANLTELAAKLDAMSASLRRTRDLLLPKLISGELDVSAKPEPEALAA